MRPTLETCLVLLQSAASGLTSSAAVLCCSDGLEGQLKSGWIFKEGRTVRIVMKRWLELDGSDLQYKSAQGGETKRVINLEEVNIELVPRTVGKVQTQARLAQIPASCPNCNYTTARVRKVNCW